MLEIKFEVKQNFNFDLRGKRINFENVIRFYTHLSIYNNKLTLKQKINKKEKTNYTNDGKTRGD